MIQDEIIESVNRLSDKDKQQWTNKSLMLFRQFESSLFLSEPFRLVLDSNIIMRFENPYQKEDYNTSLLAILTFFKFFNSQSDFRASILIRPAVYYELIRRRQLNSEIDYWEQCKRIRKMIKDCIGIGAQFEGLSSFEIANHWITTIQEDEIKIKKELNSINEKSWDFDFIRTKIGYDGIPRHDGTYIAFPTSVARQSVNVSGLKFFDNEITKLCLADHVLEKLINNPNNNHEIISKYYSAENHLLHKIIKIRSNGELEGLADLDFLSTCNVNKQFQIQANHNYMPSSIPMTVDLKLSQGLDAFSKAIVINTTYKAGEPEDIIKMKHEQSFEQQIRIKDSEKLFNRFRDLARDYWKVYEEKITFANRVGSR